MQIENKKQLAAAYRVGPYAWPGGYPMFLLFNDGVLCCWECFKSEYGSIAESTKDQDSTGWCAAGMMINYEDADATCGHCSKKLESAYGEDN